MSLCMIVATLLLCLFPAATGCAQESAAADIPDSRYVRPTGDGDLVLDGERVRFWGFIGGVASRAPKDPAEVPGRTRAERKQWIEQERRKIDRMVDRIDNLGFNMVRCWEGRYRQPSTLVFCHDYEVGDGSQADMIAYYFNQLAKRNIKLWMSSTNKAGYITPDDVDILDDPRTADRWQQAMRKLQRITGRGKFIIRGSSGRTEGLVRMWDPRWEAMVIKRLSMLADFPNQYKGGLRLGEDPQVVVWEFTNEEFAFRGLFNGKWKKLPAFFRNELLVKWHKYLGDKYGSTEELAQAWGFLLEGERVEDGTVMLAPLANPISPRAALNDSNPQLVKTLTVHAARYTRDDFTRQRGADVVEFFTKLVVAHKRRLEKALHRMGKSCRLSPTVYDSGNSYRIQSSYMHQFADAVSTCSYGKTLAHDPTHKRWPFHSNLEASPRTASGTVPWFEQSPVKGKPHFVYETNLDNRSKYRAEYPMQVAALGSINDWDIVCWHSYSGRPGGLLSDEPFNIKMAVGGDNLVYRGDEVMLSAMKAAGEIFKRRLARPVEEPTTFVFGRRSLYDPVSMDYGKSYGELGRRFIPTAYRYGAQVRVDPARMDDEIVGPSSEPGLYEPASVKPTDEITFAWQDSCLTFDSPAVASYTGFFAEYPADAVRLPTSKVTFRDIKVVNPPKMPYPVGDDERYVELTVASTDGRPLARTSKAVISAVSTSFNSGYKLNTDLGGKHRELSRRDMWRRLLVDNGRAPVLVARVGVTITCPAIDGMHYRMRDFHMRTIAEGQVAGGKLVIPTEKPVFLVELTR